MLYNERYSVHSPPRGQNLSTSPADRGYRITGRKVRYSNKLTMDRLEIFPTYEFEAKDRRRFVIQDYACLTVYCRRLIHDHYRNFMLQSLFSNQLTLHQFICHNNLIFPFPFLFAASYSVALSVTF